MDRFDVIAFHDLTGVDGAAQWVKIGGGSFGCVYVGEYLGTKVAIKEVLPSDQYDVHKYLERECVIQKEARHPNIVQYIGLSKSPDSDRIFIVSEFQEGGNLRSYIADKRKPFPWPLRMSFATDIARALAYLHARNCMHRDLKGENLLLTENERIKVCDFGFARIAARNEEEMRRMSYCGTDGYMSPEILMGIDFSLPSDIFSLGVIFCEILSRHLVDANTFKRSLPSFGINADEVYEMASEGCPPAFIQLALDCVEEDPANRPNMREIVRRLREIEKEVIEREKEQSKAQMYSVGSIRGSSLHAVMGSRAGKKNGEKDNHKRPGMAPKMPSFSGQVDVKSQRRGAPSRTPSEDSTSSDDMDEAIAALEKVGIDTDLDLTAPDAASPTSPQDITALLAANLPAGAAVGNAQAAAAVSSTLRKKQGKITLADTIKAGSTFKVSGHGNPWWSDDDRTSLPPLSASWVKGGGGAANGAAPEAPARTSSAARRKNSGSSSDDKVSGGSEYSTSVVRSSKISQAHAPLASTMSVMTARGPISSTPEEDDEEGAGSTMTIKSPVARPPGGPQIGGGHSSSQLVSPGAANSGNNSPQPSFLTARSSNHAHPHEPSIANATLASSIHAPAPEDGAISSPALFHRFTLVKNGMKRPSNMTAAANAAATGIAGSAFGSLLPPAIMLTNALAKCWVCGKRIGWKPFLDCDDCPYKTHVACGELAEPSCQEMVLPPARSGSSTPVVSPEQVSARRLSRSKSPDQASVSAAAAALKAAAGNAAATPPASAPANVTSHAAAPTSSAMGANARDRGMAKLLNKAKRTSLSPPPSAHANGTALANGKKPAARV